MGKRKAKEPRRMDRASKSIIVAAFFGGVGVTLTVLFLTGVQMEHATFARTAGGALFLFIGATLASAYFMLKGDNWMER